VLNSAAEQKEFTAV